MKIFLIGSIVLGLIATAPAVQASGVGGKVNVHRAGYVKAAGAPVYQQEKPIRLRYFGGPKSPMYPG